jgi:hypothetical protein
LCGLCLGTTALPEDLLSAKSTQRFFIVETDDSVRSSNLKHNNNNNSNFSSENSANNVGKKQYERPRRQWKDTFQRILGKFVEG